MLACLERLFFKGSCSNYLIRVRLLFVFASDQPGKAFGFYK